MWSTQNIQSMNTYIMHIARILNRCTTIIRNLLIQYVIHDEWWISEWCLYNTNVCWLLGSSSDQCEEFLVYCRGSTLGQEERLDDGPNFFWSHCICFPKKQSEGSESLPSTSWLIIFCPKPVTTTSPVSSAAADDGCLPK